MIRNKFLLTLSIITLFFSNLKAQVSFTVPQFSNNIVKIDMLWNFVLINQTNEPCIGRVKVNVRQKGLQTILYTATSHQINLQQGAKNISYNEILPFTNLYQSHDFADNSLLNVGVYEVCYSFIKSSSTDEIVSLGDDCIEQIVEPINPPQLNLPEDKSQLLNKDFQFNWLPPMPISNFQNLKYQFKLVEILEGQNERIAIRDNTPFYFENNLSITGIQNFKISKRFETAKKYAWQVSAYNDKYSINTEVWSFGFLDDSITKIIENAPFIQVSSAQNNIGYMHQGYLKVNLSNTINETECTIKIIDDSQKNKKNIYENKVKIIPGENYITKELRTKEKLDSKKNYLLVINFINHKTEFVTRIKPVYYN